MEDESVHGAPEKRIAQLERERGRGDKCRQWREIRALSMGWAVDMFSSQEVVDSCQDHSPQRFYPKFRHGFPSSGEIKKASSCGTHRQTGTG